MNRIAAASGVLALIGCLATPVAAGMAEKAKNTGINAGFGVAECPKAWMDEASRDGARGIVGMIVTGPLMCGTNVAVRYLGVAADLVTLPWGDNVVKPNVFDKKPPLRLP